MSRADEPILTIEDLEVTFEEQTITQNLLPQRITDLLGMDESSVHAVDGVSLDLGENDVVALVGESGSGKTTLGKTAVALQEPTNGHVRFHGQDVWEAHRDPESSDVSFDEIRRSLQIVHQNSDGALNPYRTIMANLMEPLKLWFPEMSNGDRRERILNLFEMCGLTPSREYEQRYPHELSGGEKQRATLIRAMLMEPEVILADEPVSALDPSLRIEIMDLMLELQDEFGTSFLFISHNLEHARYIASKADGRIAIMYLGEIVEIGQPEEIIANPKHPYTQVLKWATLPIDPSDAREELQHDIPLRSLESPDVTDRPSGCRFHTRCPKAREVCAEQHPELIGEGDHVAGCFRNDETHEYWDSQSLGDEEAYDL